MQIDNITLKDLGIFDSEDHIGLSTHLNFCKSNGGKQQLDALLANPLSNQQAIENRQAALSIFIQKRHVLEAMKITNGSILVINKFFETGFSTIPVQISIPGAYWYQFWNKADYSLIQYSVTHFIDFFNGLQEWVMAFEQTTQNPVIHKLVEDVQKLVSHPTLLNLPSSQSIKHPQQILEYGHFFFHHYKHNIHLLLNYFFEIDAFYSMACAFKEFQFEFPTWIDAPQPYLAIHEASHPLVQDPISNDLTLTNDRNFLFLTGANMAGKSTFIKTVGVVIYLAHVGMGTPTKKTTLTVMDGLITNLTIADNIIKGESYFYNEVKRIKNTVERISDGKKYCILIDELFKGTNIQDAMKCSIKVIEGLQKLRSSLFILSTHLYEISEQLLPYSNIQFSYFETQVKDNNLLFHYKLKEGVSQDRIGYLILEHEGVVNLLDKL